jgi:hypothetical protein
VTVLLSSHWTQFAELAKTYYAKKQTGYFSSLRVGQIGDNKSRKERLDIQVPSYYKIVVVLNIFY